MHNLLRLALVLPVLMASVIAHAQSLWGGTEYGMSLGQVMAIVPSAIHPNKSGRLADGAQELLQLRDVEIANEKFTTSFFFASNKLTQVTISLNGGHTFHQALLVFNSLTEALRAKYGREISNDIKRGTLNQASATWIAGQTNITLLAFSVGEEDAILNINYQVRVARDAEKL